MSSKRGDFEFLADIKEAIKRIEIYINELDYEEFFKKIEKQDAVLRNLEIIGEAVKNLSADFRKKHKDIEWKNIVGMRDKIIHFYFGIKWDIVWSIIKNKIPELKKKIEPLLKELEK